MRIQRVTRRVVSGARYALPVLLLGYAAARWVDGRDGSHGPGPAWDLGHLAFLAAFACFAVIVVALNRAVAARGGRRRLLAALTGTVGLAGVGLFGWVILGDLSPGFEAAYELPDPLVAVGPLFFLVGLAGPLLSLAWATPRLVPRAAPIAVVLAFAALAANLDLLAPAALLFGYGVWWAPAAYDPAAAQDTEPAYSTHRPAS